MSQREHGQGAELRPRPPRYRQTILFRGNPLKPEGYLFQKKIDEDLAQAHLLGNPVKARRNGAIADYIAPDKYIRLSEAKSQKQMAKEATLSQADLQPVGNEANLHDSWPRYSPIGSESYMRTFMVSILQIIIWNWIILSSKRCNSKLTCLQQWK